MSRACHVTCCAYVKVYLGRDQPIIVYESCNMIKANACVSMPLNDRKSPEGESALTKHHKPFNPLVILWSYTETGTKPDLRETRTSQNSIDSCMGILACMQEITTLVSEEIESIAHCVPRYLPNVETPFLPQVIEISFTLYKGRFYRKKMTFLYTGEPYLHQAPLEHATSELIRKNVQPTLLLHFACLPSQGYHRLPCFSQCWCGSSCLNVALFLLTDIVTQSAAQTDGLLTVLVCLHEAWLW